jgi:adenylosuccinate synthase
MINGVTQLIMTKADVLDALENLQVCNEYIVNGKRQSEIPFQMLRMDIEPVYKKFDGWQTDITVIKNYEELPVKMKEYINYMNTSLGVPVKYISNGPGSNQLIVAS